MIKYVSTDDRNYVNPKLLKDYKQYPGPLHVYDSWPHCFLPILFGQGMTEKTRLLDVGCGPLRGGRHLIAFLEKGNYFGIEPEKRMVRIALREEIVKKLGRSFLKYKDPKFSYNSDFDFSEFETSFDMIIAIQVFIHCGRKQFCQCLSSVQKFLRSSGKFILSVQIAATDGERDKRPTDHWSYRYASHSGTCYKLETFLSIVDQYGFKAENIKGHLWSLTRKE